MKITRHKLNSLLRSGLNPDITTRKQLAKVLKLDPTTLTRWFASHDRLGNPRYPVVPDRHVKSILGVFTLQLSDLNLSDEDFKHFCFDKTLSSTNAPNQAPVSLELPDSTQASHSTLTKLKENNTATWIAFCIATLLTFCLFLRSDLKVDGLYRLNQMIANTPKTCWDELNTDSQRENPLNQDLFKATNPIRFSSSPSSSAENSERCSYNAILAQGLLVLDQHQSSALDNSLKLVDLLTFVNKKMDDSQTERKALVRFEMGREEMRNQRMSQASAHFSEALQLLTSLPSVDKTLFRKTSTHASLAYYGDKPWWYARQLSDSTFLTPINENVEQGGSWRSAARADAEVGRTYVSFSNIDQALNLDSKNLGYDHPVMASNWLLKSQILNLHGDLRQAREFAHRAIVLDSYIFGENHPRVAQDKMHYALILLQEGEISAAYDTYKDGHDFFKRYPFSNHNILKSGESLLLSLDKLKAPNLSDRTGIINRNEAWNELRQALREHDFMLPRCLTTKIWEQLLKQQSLTISV